MRTPVIQPQEMRSVHQDVKALTRALSAPFESTEVRFKPAVVSGNRAMALAYVDARVIQDRLDEVLGAEGWQDSYRCLPDGSVVCRLRLRLGDEWVTKMDVGGPSEQPDGGDRMKAAFSDALKRAAVKFGVGRYLYRLPSQWVDYDPQRRQFVRPPTLPAFALPAKQMATPAVKSPAAGQPAEPKSEPAAARKASRKQNPHALPASGTELQRRLSEYDAKLATQGLCRPGELVKHVVSLGVKAGYGPDLAAWSGPAIDLAVEQTKTFEADARQTRSPQREVA